MVHFHLSDCLSVCCLSVPSLPQLLPPQGTDPVSESQISLSDFNVLKVIGRGSYAKVLMVSEGKGRGGNGRGAKVEEGRRGGGEGESVRKGGGEGEG